MKFLRCRDVGFDCDHEIRAQSEEEVIQQAAIHAKEVHHAEATPELVSLVQSQIQDESTS